MDNNAIIMNVGQFYEKFAHSPIKVMSGYNDKVLAKHYDPKKHKHISERNIISIWSEIEISKSHGFSQFAHPILCVYVLGDVEYNEDYKNFSK